MTAVATAGPAAGATRSADARLVLVAITLWAGALIGLTTPPRLAIAVVVTPTAAGAAWWAAAHGTRPPASRGTTRNSRGARAAARTAAVLVLCLLAGVVAGLARSVPLRSGPVSELAESGAYVHVEAVVVSDPDRREGTVRSQDGSPSAYVVARLRIDRVTGRGQAHRVRTPVVLVAGESGWAGLLPGQHVGAAGTLSPADGGDVAAVLRMSGEPRLIGGPGLASRATEPLRAGLRGAVSGLPEGPRGLVPALVVGDESLMTEEVRDDMRMTGLAHLSAVSGTNVTIVVVLVLGLARWCGVRGYALPALALLTVGGFVLLARPEPSVVRAAVMGAVAVVGLTVAGRRRGVPALAAAVTLLIVADPWLALSPGFAMSVLATAGIVILAPGWQRAMRWLPAPIGLAVAVPLAAQVACAPIVLAVSGQASLASLPANMLVAPAVPPATIAGVAAALVSPVSDPVAEVFGRIAGAPAGWIVAVAHWFAGRPGAVAEWPGGPGGVVLAVAASVTAAVILPVMLKRPVVCVMAAACLGIMLVWIPTPGWPPPGWQIVACDVGQGDALALRAGPGSAVVVDAGPDPRAVQRCLDSLGVRHVPLLILTHFHTDHVMGVPGVLAGRSVDHALISPLPEPEPNAAAVGGWLRGANVPTSIGTDGFRWGLGPALDLEVVWPARLIDSDESAANNASVAVLADVGGIRALLTGDLEPTAQAAMLRVLPSGDLDVIKVAHHGSAHQDPRVGAGLGAAVALISVGDNDYGHPAARVLENLRAAGVMVRRTDEHGSIAVVDLGDGHLGVVTGGPRVAEPG